MKKVQIGDSFQIPAVDYNAFVDATTSFRSGQLDGGAPLVSNPNFHTLKVLNASFLGLGQYSYLGVRDVFYPPDGVSGDDVWSNQPILKGEIYNPEIHDFFVVLQESIQKDSMGAGLVQGITPAKVVVRDAAHKFATPNVGFSSVFETTATGPAKILWKESENIGAGTWMLLELGANSSSLIPITLVRVGGVGGDDSNPASWTYDVTDALTGATLATKQNPSADPHKFARPLGQAAFADFGYAHFNKQIELVIGWVNETTAGGGSGTVFPITLSNAAGFTGSPSTLASLTYTVTNTLTSVVLGTFIDPTRVPNKFVRSFGKKNPATFGYAHTNGAGATVIGWINEVAAESSADLFPIKLIMTSGEGGSETSQANYRYTVQHAITNTVLGSVINPQSPPHQFIRAIAKVRAATFGYAHITADNVFVIGWINEALVAIQGFAFPITLTVSSGGSGDATSTASFRYTVLRQSTGETLATNLDPTGFPNRYRRSVGEASSASFGYGHVNVAAEGRFEVGWVNEALKVGSGVSSGSAMFSVKLFQVSGSGGTASSTASFGYDVREQITNNLLASNLNPAITPHEFRRARGLSNSGSIGLAYRTPGGNLILTWVNEVPFTQACQ